MRGNAPLATGLVISFGKSSRSPNDFSGKPWMTAQRPKSPSSALRTLPLGRARATIHDFVPTIPTHWLPRVDSCRDTLMAVYINPHRPVIREPSYRAMHKSSHCGPRRAGACEFIHCEYLCNALYRTCEDTRQFRQLTLCRPPALRKWSPTAAPVRR